MISTATQAQSLPMAIATDVLPGAALAEQAGTADLFGQILLATEAATPLPASIPMPVITSVAPGIAVTGSAGTAEALKSAGGDKEKGPAPDAEERGTDNEDKGVSLESVMTLITSFFPATAPSPEKALPEQGQALPAASISLPPTRSAWTPKIAATAPSAVSAEEPPSAPQQPSADPETGVTVGSAKSPSLATSDHPALPAQAASPAKPETVAATPLPDTAVPLDKAVPDQPAPADKPPPVPPEIAAKPQAENARVVDMARFAVSPEPRQTDRLSAQSSLGRASQVGASDRKSDQNQAIPVTFAVTSLSTDPVINSTPFSVLAANPAAPLITTDTAVPGAQFELRQLDLARDTEWLDTLAKDIVSASQNDDRLSFRLMPRELGRLDVNLSTTEAGLSVKMLTSSEDARAAVAAHQPRLIEELRGQGIRVAGAEVGTGDNRQSQRNRNAAAPFIETSANASTKREPVSSNQPIGRFA